MITKLHIRELVEQNTLSGDLFIVDIKVGKGNKIAIWVDKDQGITIDECVEISRHVEDHLDRESEDFDLDVSSPGLDMPFKVKRQYEKYLNRMVEVVTLDGGEKRGKLIAVSEDGVELECVNKSDQHKKGKTEKVSCRYNFDQIKTTKAVIEFK